MKWDMSWADTQLIQLRCLPHLRSPHGQQKKVLSGNETNGQELA